MIGLLGKANHQSISTVALITCLSPSCWIKKLHRNQQWMAEPRSVLKSSFECERQPVIAYFEVFTSLKQVSGHTTTGFSITSKKHDSREVFSLLIDTAPKRSNKPEHQAVQELPLNINALYWKVAQGSPLTLIRPELPKTNKQGFQRLVQNHPQPFLE